LILEHENDDVLNGIGTHDFLLDLNTPDATFRRYFAGAVAAGVGAVNSFMAFCTVYLSPHAVGTMTMIHATAIISDEDFFTVAG
jgi:hypothetical protein